MDETEILEAMEEVLKKETFTPTKPYGQKLFDEFVDWMNERLKFDLLDTCESVFDPDVIEEIVDELAVSHYQADVVGMYLEKPFWH